MHNKYLNLLKNVILEKKVFRLRIREKTSV